MGWTHDPRMTELADGYVWAYYTIMSTYVFFEKFSIIKMFHTLRFIGWFSSVLGSNGHVLIPCLNLIRIS